MFSRTCLPALSLILALTPCIGAPPDEATHKEELIKKDLEKMQGDWVLVDNEKPVAKEKPPAKEAKKPEWIIRDGIWVLASIEKESKPAVMVATEPAGIVLKDGHLVIKDTGYRFTCTMLTLPASVGFDLTGTLALDPTKAFKCIERKDRQKGEILRGIYEIDGDTLKIATATAPDLRPPKEFAVPETGIDYVFLTFKRKLKK